MATPAIVVASPGRFRLGLFVFVLLVCIMPTVLNLAGLDFSVQEESKVVSVNYHGLLLHTILVWSATCTAFFTFLLSIFHYSLRRDIVAPVIGISLVWGGFMDVFQTLSADRLLQADEQALAIIPFTWLLGRTFGVIILLIGVMVLMVRGYHSREQGNSRLFVLLAVAFGLGAYATSRWSSSLEYLPQLIYPDQLISRPFDVFPLIIYAIAGAWVFRRFHSERRDNLSFAVWIGILPDFVTQLHMAFGSNQLFDNHYNIAQVFKITSYLVPALGMLRDFMESHRKLETEVDCHLQTEKRRRELSNLVNQSSEMVLILEENGELRYRNRAVQRNLGIQEEGVNIHLSSLLHAPLPQQEEKRILESLGNRSQVAGATELVTRDGSRLIPVEYSLFRMTGDGISGLGMILRDDTQRQRQVEERERHQMELRQIISQRTGELAEANLRLKRELRERKALEEQLVQAQKMESMGQLAAGIAHEINNPLGYVLMNFDSLGRYVESFRTLVNAQQAALDKLSHQTGDWQFELATLREELRFEFVESDVLHLLDESRTGLHRVRDIIQNLRFLSRRDEEEMQECNLCQIMDNALKVLGNETKKHTVERNYGDVPAIAGWPGLLAQIFVNLIVNACQAMENSGILRISIQSREHDLQVQISDTGKGIPRIHYSRIFDPFFTTKPPGLGTGLGLYISYGIARKHQGDLFFWSTEDKGTTFQLTLPKNKKNEQVGNSTSVN